jgi:hypothetical protein
MLGMDDFGSVGEEAQNHRSTALSNSPAQCLDFISMKEGAAGGLGAQPSTNRQS